MSLIEGFTPQQKSALKEVITTDFKQFIKFSFKIRSGGNFIFQPHHEIIIDTLQKVIDGKITRLIMVIPPRHSKCLVGGEKVLTTSGYKNVEDITTQDSAYSYIEGKAIIQNIRKTEAFEKETIKISTRSGRTLKLSKDHPVLTQRGWVNAEDLTKQHFIMRLNTKLDTNNRIDSNELDFITLMLFEGGTSFKDGKNLRFTNFDPEVVSIFKSACDGLGINLKEYREGHYSCLGGKKGTAARLVQKWGLEGKLSIDKELPKEFYVLPLDQKYRFLSLMYATDGFISTYNKSLGITLGSEKLAKDVSLFLDTVGVPSDYSSHENGFAGSPTTVVSRVYAEKLVSNLDLLQKQKTWDSLPTTRGQVVTEHTFDRIVNEIDSSKLSFKKDDFIYDQVSSLEDQGVQMVYHLDIDSDVYDNKNFIGNGLVVHNSELVSVMLTAFAYVRNRRAEIIQTTYSDSLCREMSTGVRDILFSEEFVDLFGFQLRKDKSALNGWGIKEGGTAHFVPTGGSLTGFGAGTLDEGFTGLMVIDDPLKPEDSYSQTRREGVNNRYTNTLLSRLAKRKETPIVIIQQRLHSSDMCGFLLNGGSGEKFHYLMLPAILESDTGSEKWYKDQLYTHSLPIEYDFKVPKGEQQALWSTRVDLDELKEMEEGDIYTFSSQYMGDPVPAGGSIFKREWFKLYNEVPHSEIQYLRIYADTAMKTGQHHDFSVLQCWAYTKNGDMYLIDMLRGKWESPELLDKFIQFYKKWKVDNKLFKYSLQCAVVENKASGTGLIQQANRVPGLIVREVQADRDKVSKAMSAAPVCQAGRVYIPENAQWVDQFLIEVCSFSPTMAHKHDDITDVLISACFDLVINNSNIWTEAML